MVTHEAPLLDSDRQAALTAAMHATGMDLLMVALPTNVLLLSGYWPIVGTTLALYHREGRLLLVVPSDEKPLARRRGGDCVRDFSTGSLAGLSSLLESVEPVLQGALKELSVQRGVVGLEFGPAHQPASYVAMNFYGAALGRFLHALAPELRQVEADELLRQQRLIKTPRERQRIQAACRIAGRVFNEGRGAIRAGQTETDAANQAGKWLGRWGDIAPDVAHAGGSVYCMSGPNSAQAYASFQRSGQRMLLPGDVVLLHCNSHADGYCTDITRTFILEGGPAPQRAQALGEAIGAARQAALGAIRPGTPAREVDAAARAVMHERGYGDDVFKHPTGHGVGFAAIDHRMPPRLHPKSPDVLREGMIFNVEPGGYFADDFGMRHCDMVAVTAGGCDLLTPF